MPEYIQDYRKRWLLTVGVNDYGKRSITGLTSLKNAVNDACEIYRVLTNEYEFSGILLSKTKNTDNDTDMQSQGNGSQTEILSAISKIAKSAAHDDLFVFFYAGHGTHESRGYMAPYGAINGKYTTYLSYEAFFSAISQLPCHHQLLLFDCCFAGKAMRINPLLNNYAHPNQVFDLQQDGRGIEFLNEDEIVNDNTILGQGPICLGQQTVICCATNSFKVTRDSFEIYNPDNQQRSKNSAFTHAIVKIFETNGSGQWLSAAQILAQLETQVAVLHGQNVIQPRANMTGDGDGHMQILRPGLRIDMPKILFCQWQILTKTLVAKGGELPYCWSLTNVKEGISINNGSLRVIPEALGEGDFKITIQVSDTNGNSITHELTVIIRNIDFVFNTKYLEPCFVGSDYYALIETTGVAPQSWQIGGLPEGLQFSEENQTISGLIRETDYIKNKGLKLNRLITIEAITQNSESCCCYLPFAIINTSQYCEVPAGKFQIGYTSSQVMQNEIHRIASQNQTNPIDLAEDIKNNSYSEGVVYLPRYFIKRYPVTRSEWRVFYEHTKDSKTLNISLPTGWKNKDDSDLPVTGIKYEDILAYCRWRGTRLPTGWEWEKAARGETGNLYPWGNDFNLDFCNGPELWGDPEGDPDDPGRYCRRLTPVDQFPNNVSSTFCVMDLIGNVWERVMQWRSVGSGNWKACLRGGSYQFASKHFLSNVATSSGLSFELNSDGVLEPDEQEVSVTAGFRDIIEVDSDPPCPQKLVSLKASQFFPPRVNREICTQTVFIAQYMVSNLEYLEFIQATGYDRPCHWQQQEDIYPFPYEARHFPVVNVSFSDAQEFCHWYSKKTNNITVRVLAKKIWQAAVHGPGGGLNETSFTPRQYPWGDSFNALNCNVRESEWAGLIPVFWLPNGKSPCCAFNLIGNAAEWVGPNQVAGGSWLNTCINDSVIYQACSEPRPDVGFRYYSTQSPDNI